MRRATILSLIFLAVSWVSGFGQSAPKFTSPKIVATFQRLNRTTEIHPTAIYKPSSWGMFRVSVVIVAIKANGEGNGGWQPILVATDGGGSYEQDGPRVSTNVQGTAAGEFLVRAKPGAPLFFYVSSGGDTSGSKYNVFVVVEQLM
jgi:hypothetical protein